MANPSLPANEKKMDYDDLYAEVEGVVVNDKVVVSTQQSNVADDSTTLTVTWTLNDPGGTPDGAITIADGDAITAAETAEFLEEVEAGFAALSAKINAILDVLEAHGLMADS